MVLFRVSVPLAKASEDSAAPLVPGGAAAFDGSGEFLAVEAVDRRIRVFSLRDHTLTCVFAAAVPSIAALAVRRGGQVAAGAHDGSIVIQDSAGGRVIATLSTGTGSLTALAFSPDGQLLAAGDAVGNGVVFKVSSGEELRRAKSERPVCSVAIPDSGAPLLLGGPDGYMGIHPWLLPPRRFVAPGSAVTALAFPQRVSGTPLGGRADGSVWRLDPFCQEQERWINDGHAAVCALWAGDRGQARALDAGGNLHEWLSKRDPPDMLRKMPEDLLEELGQLQNWVVELSGHVILFTALREQMLDALAARRVRKLDELAEIDEAERDRIRPAVADAAVSITDPDTFGPARDAVLFLNPLPSILAACTIALAMLVVGLGPGRAVGHLDSVSDWLSFAGTTLGGVWLLWFLGRLGKIGTEVRSFLVAASAGAALAGPKMAGTAGSLISGAHAASSIGDDWHAPYPVWLAISYVTFLAVLVAIAAFLLRLARRESTGTAGQRPVPGASLLHALLDVAYQAQGITRDPDLAVSPAARARLHHLIGQAARTATREWVSDLLTGSRQIDNVIRAEGAAIAASIRRWERRAALGGAELPKLSHAFAVAVVNAADNDWEALAGNAVPPPRRSQQAWKLAKHGIGLAAVLGTAAGIYLASQPLSASAASVIIGLLVLAATQILRWLGLAPAIESALSVSQLFHKPN